MLQRLQMRRYKNRWPNRVKRKRTAAAVVGGVAGSGVVAKAAGNEAAAGTASDPEVKGEADPEVINEKADPEVRRNNRLGVEQPADHKNVAIFPRRSLEWIQRFCALDKLSTSTVELLKISLAIGSVRNAGVATLRGELSALNVTICGGWSELRQEALRSPASRAARLRVAALLHPYRCLDTKRLKSQKSRKLK